jgi:N utilization substance protein A
VRLASRLVGWKIDVKSESRYSKSLKEGYLSLLRIPGVGEITANLLHEGGFNSAQDLGETTVEDLVQATGLTEKKAGSLIAAAQEMARGDMAESAPGQTATTPEVQKGQES